MKKMWDKAPDPEKEVPWSRADVAKVIVWVVFTVAWLAACFLAVGIIGGG